MKAGISFELRGADFGEPGMAREEVIQIEIFDDGRVRVLAADRKSDICSEGCMDIPTLKQARHIFREFLQHVEKYMPCDQERQ